MSRDYPDVDEMANGARLAVGVDRWMCCWVFVGRCWHPWFLLLVEGIPVL